MNVIILRMPVTVIVLIFAKACRRNFYLSVLLLDNNPNMNPKPIRNYLSTAFI